jgi:hypothetical protein
MEVLLNPIAPSPRRTTCLGIIRALCRDVFGQRTYEVSQQSLSGVNAVHRVRAGSERYVAKLIPLHNTVSFARTDVGTIRAIARMSSRIAASTAEVRVPRVVKVRSTAEGTFVLMVEEPLHPCAIVGRSSLIELGRAIRAFHDGAGRGPHSFLEGRPWNCLTPEFERALYRHERFEDCERHLAKTSFVETRDMNLGSVVCHNDLHAGNVWRSERTLFFLDLDESCIASPLNDIGVALANFGFESERTEPAQPDRVLEAIDHLVEGYDLRGVILGAMASDARRHAILAYALRKLHLIEAHLLYVEDLGFGSPEDSSTLSRLPSRQTLVAQALGIEERWRNLRE